MKISEMSEREWHELRAKNVGASEVAALFGVHKQMSAWELHHIKAGGLEPRDLSDNVRVRCGRNLESGIALSIAEIHNLGIEAGRYLEDVFCKGLAASLDYEIISGLGLDGPAPLEIKNVDGLIFKENWFVGPETLSSDRILDIEPPLHIDLQLQTQMACAGADVGFLGVMVNGNMPLLIRRERHEKAITDIREKVSEFWGNVHAKKEPLINEPSALDAVTRMYANQRNDRPAAIDLSHDNEAGDALSRYLDASQQRKDFEKEEKTAKAILLAKIGEARGASINGTEIKMSDVKAFAGKEITPEMIGQFIGARAAHRRMSVKGA